MDWSWAGNIFVDIHFSQLHMLFSKSFGYALRGILYIALSDNAQKRIQVDEIASRLAVPRYFLSKIMKKMVRAGIINSTKGPYGGFSLNRKTLSTPLIDLILVTDGISQFQDCVLRLHKCDINHPCPLHQSMGVYREDLFVLLKNTTIGNLLDSDHSGFIKRVSPG